MKSPEFRQSARTAVGTVAVAAMLSPLNTSMFPIALPDLQREFSSSARASTWLLTVFALASAVGHPLAGYLADRLGPRRVLLAGLVVTGLTGLIAAGAATFSLLLALRTAQALGTATAFPAGIALLRTLGSQNRSDRQLPPAWLGAVAMVSNLGAALGPMLGAALLVTAGWRALFLANLPIVIAATLLLLRHFPADRAEMRRDAGRPEAKPDCPSTPTVFGVGALRCGVHGVLCGVLRPAAVAAAVHKPRCSRDGRRDGADGDRVGPHHTDRGPDRDTVGCRHGVVGRRQWLVSRHGSADNGEWTDVGGRVDGRDGGAWDFACLQ